MPNHSLAPNRFFGTISMMLITACGSPLTSPELHGEWGGRGVRVTVSVDGATLEFDCASGVMDRRPDPDGDGRFDVEGTWSPGEPVEVPGREPTILAARYRGKIDGKTMEFTGTILESGVMIGPYRASLGREPTLFKCA